MHDPHSDDDALLWFTSSGLDETTLPAFRDRILRYEQGGPPQPQPRTYPGYPRVDLPRARPRIGARLDTTLLRRRTARTLDTRMPSPARLGRILLYAHGACASQARGPVPSAGNLQALELYIAVLEPGWLMPSAYHYDRKGHYLSRLLARTTRQEWEALVPSKQQFDGGAALWMIVGDAQRPRAKYGARGLRFLLLEAGHLMQNLCLLSASVGLCTLPLGGFFERAMCRKLTLPSSDAILYVGAVGSPRK